MFFDTPYYLAPGKNAAHVYALFREALQKSGKVGIGKVAFREREHLAAIKAHGNALMLDTLFFADELAKTTGLDLPAKSTRITERERKLAEQLIAEMTTKFDAGKYRDTYREALLKMIDQKLKGKGGKARKATARKATTNVVDIMSKLKQSLKATKPATRATAKSKAKRGTKKKAA